MNPREVVLPARAFPAVDQVLHPPVQRRAGDAPLDLSGIEGPCCPRPPVGPLPAGLRAKVERRSGLPMDDVRVHRNSAEPARLGALAYAQGRDIHLGPGQERHLPHEAWHVVQQAQGRVRPTKQLKAGVAVNDDRILEHEADAMGPIAAAAPFQAAGRSTSVAPGDRRTSIVQREEYPDDSIGTIDALRKVGETEVNGATLQNAILTAAKTVFDSMPEDTPGGLRLGSYLLRVDGVLTPKLGADKGGKDEEEHGMPYLSAEQRLQLPQKQIEQLIQLTLDDAGQWQYLMNPKNESIFKTHDVIIDVDCQFDRTGQVGFHKDSRGTTAFVNLTFSNQAEMTGTERYEDLEGDPGQEELLPEEIRKDIAKRRSAAISSSSQTKDEIIGGKLPSYGRISFSDPNLYHSSPLMGNRYGSELANNSSSWASASKEEMIDLIMDFCEDYTQDEWESTDLEVIHNWYSFYITSQYHGHGLEKNSKRHGDADRMHEEAVKRARRMSADLDDPTRREAVKAEANQRRTFIRTWVRFVKKTN